MDYLFTPWRYAYVTGADKAQGCLFCNQLAADDDAGALIVRRFEHCFLVLNAFPYTSGHVMVAPYQHVGELAGLSRESAEEMITICQRVEAALRELYRPDGVNLGMNVGKAAGAGVAEHIHMHVLPRWIADSNFMSVVGETRVLPEALETTYRRLREKFA